MTKTARLVLRDAEHAIARYTEVLQDADFRVAWLAIVTLLDSVEEALRHVDSKLSHEMARAVQTRRKQNYEQKPNIYFDFINRARNDFIHKYEHGVKKSTYSELTINKVEDGTSRKLRLVISDAVGLTLNTDNGRYQSVIASGPFAGIGEKEIAMQACAWWHEYLDDVDRLAQADTSKA